MREDKLGNLSMELSVEVLQLTKELRAKHENVISNQIGRSATSICANIAESKYAHSRADFIAKLEIALKETNETSKWLEMLWKREYIDEQRYRALDRKCSTIRFLLVKSITTAKNNLNASKDNTKMTYKRIVNESDFDIPYLTSVLKLPEIACFISIDENNYWNYISHTENVFYFKIFENDNLVAATHFEISNKTLYMAIMVIPQYQRKGVATKILKDILSGKLPLDYDKIEVAIDATNIASIRLFEKMNFEFVSREDELLNYIYVKNSN